MDKGIIEYCDTCDGIGIVLGEYEGFCKICIGTGWVLIPEVTNTPIIVQEEVTPAVERFIRKNGVIIKR